MRSKVANVQKKTKQKQNENNINGYVGCKYLGDWDLEKFKFDNDQWETRLVKRSQSNQFPLFTNTTVDSSMKFFQTFTRVLLKRILLEYFTRK